MTNEQEKKLVEDINCAISALWNAESIHRRAIENISAIISSSTMIPENEKSRILKFTRIPAPTITEHIRLK